MWFIDFLTSATSVDIIFKLLLAFLFSLIIGIEREVIHKPAGIKTHSLVCISATLVMVIGIYMHDLYGEAIDPSRLPAQILAGIGFVGAGTIIRDGFSVKGITTAASLLAMTCIGLAIGAGFYEAAFFSTLLVFLILLLTSPLQTLINSSRKVSMFSVLTSESKGMISKIQEIFEENDVTVLNIKHEPAQGSVSNNLLKFLVKINNTRLKEKLLIDICNLDHVKEVYVSKTSYHQDAE